MKHFLFYFCLLLSLTSFANPGDTTKVVVFNNQTVVTDPSLGVNEYKKWVTFSSPTKKFRKAYVTMQYARPGVMACGAWDYVDNIILRRIGGQALPSKDIEIVRFITPYGNSFGTGWKFQWEMDVTDYQLLLHDSVEVAYLHSGYEGTNVGWALTVTFNFIEGTPVYEPVNITKLWEKNYWWTEVSDSTKPQTITMQANSNIARVRINHTGHGADTINYCSEFCPRYRKLSIDGANVDSVNVWRTCGANALYPQGGTWVYDRGGWCPGAMVYPYIFDKPIAAASTHTFDMSVIYPYTPTNQGTENVTAHLIECKLPQYANDASIEKILNPSTLNENFRYNPACSRPAVVIRNNGTNPLTSLQLNYGLSGQTPFSYNWSGNLATYQIDTVILPGVVNPTVNAQPFMIIAANPNGSGDQYKYDDTLRSNANKVFNYINDTIIIIETMTNNFGNETGYRLYNSSGAIIKQRIPGTLANNTTYKDTVVMSPGCYKVQILDTGGDGLYFWANSAQGTGNFFFKKKTGQILKAFTKDFGSEYTYNFTTGTAFATGVSQDIGIERLITVFPNPAKDNFSIDINLAGTQSVMIEVTDALGKKITQRKIESIETGLVKIETTGFAKGMYFVTISGKDFKEVKKVILE